FLGFLPRTGGERRRLLETVARSEWTVVLFEAPPRVANLLRDLAAACGGDRRAGVARELTKVFEETRAGTLDELAGYYAEAPAGRNAERGTWNAERQHDSAFRIHTSAFRVWRVSPSAGCITTAAATGTPVRPSWRICSRPFTSAPGSPWPNASAWWRSTAPTCGTSLTSI